MRNSIVSHTFVVLAYQESKYLEECIKSVLNQSYKSKVVIATTTDNKFIRKLAKKYHLKVIVGVHTNIGGDFDFALSIGKTSLVTIAHQDDIYDYDYAKKIVDIYRRYPDSNIIFSDYYEIRDNKKIVVNLNLMVKRFLLVPLRLKYLSRFCFFKRLGLRFGNSICCPAVTFVKENCPEKIFDSCYRSNVDWYAFEKLSKLSGRFIYVPNRLMGHRISLESTTTSTLMDNVRTREDYEMFCKFWPKWGAKFINYFYKSAEKSNEIKKFN